MKLLLVLYILLSFAVHWKHDLKQQRPRSSARQLASTPQKCSLLFRQAFEPETLSRARSMAYEMGHSADEFEKIIDVVKKGCSP